MGDLRLRRGRLGRGGGFFRIAAAGAVDAGGAAPLGEDFRIGAEEVTHGGVEALDEGASFLNEGTGLGGGADVGELVVGLIAALAGDFPEIGLEGGDEVGGE